MFQEQVGVMGQWFGEWTEAEQMVLLYSLLKRLSPLQVRFLSRVIEQHDNDCGELQMLEQQANNPAMISSLLSKGKDFAMQQLLVWLPLLRPDNVDAKNRYLSMIPTVLSHCVESGQHLAEAKQLVSYSLIHPAMMTDDRHQLAPWVQILKARFNMLSNTILPLPETHAGGWNSRSCKDTQPTRVRRSNSLTPPVSLHQSTELWTSQDDLCAKQKPRSFSLSSSEHVPPLSPQSSQASSGSGSESQLDENKSLTCDLPGMRDVGTWLKALRLHKYMWLFAQLTYEEMLSLTEEKLESAGVTKGARHKIILSIRKLRERYATVCQLEKDVVRGTTTLMTVLEELKTILTSPIKPVENSETETKTEQEAEDIPKQLTKVLGKVCTHLIVNGGREEDAVRLATCLLERCLSHEAFSAHRRRLDTWRLQIHTLWQHTHHKHKWHRHDNSTCCQTQPFSWTDTRTALRRHYTTPTNQSRVYQPASVTYGSALVPPTPASTGNYQTYGSAIMTPNEPACLTQSPRVVLPSLSTQQLCDKPAPESDINSTLEDLCLSMAEHFLEGVS